MKQIYRIKNRLLISLAAGMTAVSLLHGMPEYTSGKNVMAWWGSIYPEFCFSQLNDETADSGEKRVEQQPKISFWLAKALERW